MMKLGVLWLVSFALHAQKNASDRDWSDYGGSLAGQRYSAHNQINPKNVKSLGVAWIFHTGMFSKPSKTSNGRANFEATPVLWHEKLYFDTPFDEVFAISAVSGQKVWSYDPGVNRESEIYIVSSRGVSLWHSRTPSNATCEQDRVFVATLDRRLIARDAETGKACPGFGKNGTVDLAAGMNLKGLALRMFGFTSPPTVVGDIVVVGSSIGDNQAIDVAPGNVRAFDARTGKQIWSWDPIPWSNKNHPRTGSGGAWSIISADTQNDLIFVPTGSAATDYYGGERPGDNRDANSVVALRASTGKRVWAFQFVHHDVWDYDTPSEPLLFTFRGKIPAVAVVTKTGMIFVLNGLTGQPLFPVEERPVPQSDLPGEKTSPTQPFSTLPTLGPLSFRPEDLKIPDAAERKICVGEFTGLVNKGIFTPPGLRNTLMYPGSLGGANWGSAGLDPATGILYVHNNSLAYVVRQIPRATNYFQRALRFYDRHVDALGVGRDSMVHSRFRTPDGGEHSPQLGTPYELYREALSIPKNTPCSPQPWGSLVAVNVNTGQKVFAVPQGTMIAGEATGSLGVGGPVVTAGGLVFIGATMEPVLRAFEANSGRIAWEHGLPAPANATPMSYQIGSKQYLVVAAGGHGMLDITQGDSIVAFTLAKPHDAVSRKSLARHP